MEYYWWEKKVILPVRRLCRGFASRFGFRKQGIMMLSQEVQACQYEDVQIMWEMLKKNDTPRSPASLKNRSLRSRPVRHAFAWARWGTCLRTKF